MYRVLMYDLDQQSSKVLRLGSKGMMRLKSRHFAHTGVLEE